MGVKIVKKSPLVHCGLVLSAFFACASAEPHDTLDGYADPLSYAESAEALLDPEALGVTFEKAAPAKFMTGTLGKFSMKTCRTCRLIGQPRPAF